MCGDVRRRGPSQKHVRAPVARGPLKEMLAIAHLGTSRVCTERCNALMWAPLTSRRFRCDALSVGRAFLTVSARITRSFYVKCDTIAEGANFGCNVILEMSYSTVFQLEDIEVLHLEIFTFPCGRRLYSLYLVTNVYVLKDLICFKIKRFSSCLPK